MPVAAQVDDSRAFDVLADAQQFCRQFTPGNVVRKDSMTTSRLYGKPNYFTYYVTSRESGFIGGTAVSGPYYCLKFAEEKGWHDVAAGNVPAAPPEKPTSLNPSSTLAQAKLFCGTDPVVWLMPAMSAIRAQLTHVTATWYVPEGTVGFGDPAYYQRSPQDQPNLYGCKSKMVGATQDYNAYQATLAAARSNPAPVPPGTVALPVGPACKLGVGPTDVAITLTLTNPVGTCAIGINAGASVSSLSANGEKFVVISEAGGKYSFDERYFGGASGVFNGQPYSLTTVDQLEQGMTIYKAIVAQRSAPTAAPTQAPIPVRTATPIPAPVRTATPVPAVAGAWVPAVTCPASDPLVYANAGEPTWKYHPYYVSTSSYDVSLYQTFLRDAQTQPGLRANFVCKSTADRRVNPSYKDWAQQQYFPV